ncbi:MAG TPA: hypothetical protein VMV45_20920 [Casimicrobiaceae bacterium]|nr:hypothetical protein [Casimicrobiaceae bacterium]
MPDSVSGFGIAVGALLVAACIVASIAVGFVLVHPGTQRPSRTITPPRIASPVVLQPAPERDIAAFRAEKQRLLGEYAWLDRRNGIVRIPIDQAIAIIVRSGKLPSQGASR